MHAAHVLGSPVSYRASHQVDIKRGSLFFSFHAAHAHSLAHVELYCCCLHGSHLCQRGCGDDVVMIGDCRHLVHPWLWVRWPLVNI